MSDIKFKRFSPKQLTVLNWWTESSPHKTHDAIICDGAVRSGKTLCMSLSFILWSLYRFSDSSFALCGKTISSLRRNVVTFKNEVVYIWAIIRKTTEDKV